MKYENIHLRSDMGVSILDYELYTFYLILYL